MARTRTARVWYERAAAAGHAEAALQVGIALLREGDEHGAERHLRCAAGGGSVEAAFRLGVLAGAPAPPQEAGDRSASRRADAATSTRSGTSVRPSRGTGVPRCGSACARRPVARSSTPPAGTASAAEAGSPNGAFNLGLLLAREGSEPEAALWWTRAAEAGHGRAALRLALLSARRGELDEGQWWCARAVELGPAEVAERAARLRDALQLGADRVSARTRAVRAGTGGARQRICAGRRRRVRVTTQRRGVEQLGSSLGS